MTNNVYNFEGFGGGVVLPNGNNTTDRPAAGSSLNGLMRYNTVTNLIEFIANGSYTSLSTISTASNNTIVSNISGISTFPISNSITSVFDTLGSTQGDLLYRNSTVWTTLAPGSAGQVLISGGTAANPSWATITGTGTVTSITAGTGLSGGTITGAGTISVTSNGITSALFRQSNALSVVGNGTNATANVSDITGIANQVLVVNSAGTTLSFGQLNLASTAAVTGALGTANGGTGSSTTFTSGSVVFAGSSGIYSQDNSKFYWLDSGPNLAIGARGSVTLSATTSIFNTTGQNLSANNVGSQSSTGGALITLNALPTGAAITSGSQLGTIQFGGSQDTAQTLALSASINSVSTQNWTSSHLGSSLLFYTVPNNFTTPTLALTLGQDQSSTFSGAVVGNSTLSISNTSHLIGAVTLGTNTSTSGTLLIANGGGSGASITIQNNSATTAYNFNLPATPGTAGQVLTSQAGGSSAMTWTTITGVPVGTMLDFAANSAPSGYLICDGSAISRSTYANLFAVISTIYGSGDGSTTFNLPNTLGYFTRGFDSSGSRDPGRVFGSTQSYAMQSHTHTASVSDPGHLHSINDPSHAHTGGFNTSGTPLGTSDMGAGANSVNTGNSTTGITINTATTSISVTNASTGSTETRPYNIAITKIIKY